MPGVIGEVLGVVLWGWCSMAYLCRDLKVLNIWHIIIGCGSSNLELIRKLRYYYSYGLTLQPVDFQLQSTAGLYWIFSYRIPKSDPVKLNQRSTYLRWLAGVEWVIFTDLSFNNWWIINPSPQEKRVMLKWNPFRRECYPMTWQYPEDYVSCLCRGIFMILPDFDNEEFS